LIYPLAPALARWVGADPVDQLTPVATPENRSAQASSSRRWPTSALSMGQPE
jgi:hypothetical protein